MIFLLIPLTVVCAILYRLGGASPEAQQREFPWIPRWFRRMPKKRDAGCGACVVAAGYCLGITAPWWAWFLAWGLMWGALSTYWDFVFIYDVDNHFIHGTMIALALFPVMFFDESLALFARVALLGLSMGLWSAFNGNATWEELGRGALMVPTLVLVLLI